MKDTLRRVLLHLKSYLAIGRAKEFHCQCQFRLAGSGYWGHSIEENLRSPKISKKIYND